MPYYVEGGLDLDKLRAGAIYIIAGWSKEHPARPMTYSLTGRVPLPISIEGAGRSLYTQGPLPHKGKVDLPLLYNGALRC